MMASEEMTFGQLLKKLMEEADMTQGELADKISKYNSEEHEYEGVSRETIFRWVHDRNKPQRKKYVLDIIEALHLKKQGTKGVKNSNALLQKAGYEELNEEELEKYFVGMQKNVHFTEFLKIKSHVMNSIKALIPLLSLAETYCEICISVDDSENEGQIDLNKVKEGIRLIDEGLTITHQGEGEK